MATIALLGTGLLGQGFAENLLNKGHTVRVWNRTKNKLAGLIERGAIATESPDECVRGAERVHLVLSEDDAVDDVIAKLREGLSNNTPVIDHSTNLPKKVKARFDQLRASDVRYVSAPVFMAPKHARSADGLMLISGPPADTDELRPALEEMTGKLWHVGDRADLAAVYKLAGNSVYFAVTGAVADVLAMARENDVEPETAMQVFSEFKPGSGLHMVERRIAGADKDRPASFEMTMAEKDARLMAEAAGEQPLFVLPAILEAMRQGIAKGYGKADFAAFAKA
ncbi:MAG: NAD(P)-dependent oxidoreductase [Planctomycetota bacterium]